MDNLIESRKDYSKRKRFHLNKTKKIPFSAKEASGRTGPNIQFKKLKFTPYLINLAMVLIGAFAGVYLYNQTILNKSPQKSNLNLDAVYEIVASQHEQIQNLSGLLKQRDLLSKILRTDLEIVRRMAAITKTKLELIRPDVLKWRKMFKVVKHVPKGHQKFKLWMPGGGY